MATDEKINDAIQAYLTEQAYGSSVTDGLMIFAVAWADDAARAFTAFGSSAEEAARTLLALAPIIDRVLTETGIPRTQKSRPPRHRMARGGR